MAATAQLRSSVQSMTVTNLHSLANSATAGWQSAVVDNSSDLYDEIEVQVILDFANAAPANSKGVYVFQYDALESTYTNPASGSEGSITLTDVTTTPQNLRQIGFITYITADEVVESRIFRFRPGAMWGIVLMNHSGAALAASGNTVKWVGIKETIA